MALADVVVLPASAASAVSPVSTANKRPPIPLDLVQLKSILPLDSEGSGDTQSLSPDGKWVVLQTAQADVEHNTYRFTWVAVSTTPGGRAVELADAGEINLFRDHRDTRAGLLYPTSPILWSADSQWILYRARYDGAVQLWRARIDGSQQEQLTHGPADVQEFRWSADGSKLLFQVLHRSRVEIKRRQVEAANSGYRLDERFNLKGDTQPLLPPETATDVWVRELTSATERLATTVEQDELGRLLAPPTPASCNTERLEAQKSGVAKPLSFNGRCDRIAVAMLITPANRPAYPNSRVGLISTAGATQPKPCRSALCTGIIDTLWWSEDGREIYFRRLEGVSNGVHGVYVWSLADDRVRVIFRSTDRIGTTAGTGCSRLKDRWICVHAGEIAVAAGGGHHEPGSAVRADELLPRIHRRPQTAARGFRRQDRARRAGSDLL